MNIQKIRNFRKTLRHFDQLTNIQLKGCCFGVSLSQCHVLLEIEAQSHVITGQLAQRLGLDKSTLSRTIDGLVNIGLVERLPNPSDRRYTPLAVTEQGKAVCNTINRTSDDYYGRVFESIPQGKNEAIIRNFSLLVRALQEEESRRSSEPRC